MDSKIKKWIMVMLAVLVISAAAAGFITEWKKTSAIGKGKDYVAEIRIDGTIYGGPRNGTLLGASEGVSSEQVMYEMEQARKDNRVKGVLLRINSPGGSTGGTPDIAGDKADRRFHGGYVCLCRILARQQRRLCFCQSCYPDRKYWRVHGLYEC